MPNTDFKPNTTICWNCRNAVPDAYGKRGCSWSREGTPVEGWIATPRTLYQYKSKDDEMTEVIAFSVSDCPKFERG